MQHRNKPKKGEDILVVLLARGVSHVKAAKAAGVNPATVSEYLHDPAFKMRIAELRNRFMDEMVGQLNAMSGKAVKALEKLLSSPDDRIKLGAVKAWKDCLFDFNNQHDLAKRIEAMRIGEGTAADPQTVALNEILERLKKEKGQE